MAETVSGTGHIVHPYGRWPVSGTRFLPKPECRAGRREIKSVSRSFRRIFGRAVCRNGGNGNDQGRFPHFFPFASVFSDRKQDNGASSEPDREETQAWDGNDRPEVKTEKYRDTGRRKTGPSHSVETVSCRTDEAFLSSIETDGIRIPAWNGQKNRIERHA